MIGDPTLASALLNCIVHNTYWIKPSRDSLGKHKAEVELT
jgi:hypothetical protein